MDDSKTNRLVDSYVPAPPGVPVCDIKSVPVPKVNINSHNDAISNDAQPSGVFLCKPIPK